MVALALALALVELVVRDTHGAIEILMAGGVALTALKSEATGYASENQQGTEWNSFS